MANWLGGRPFGEVSSIFRTFGWAERRPALAQAVAAPLICWSFSSSMFYTAFGLDRLMRPSKVGDRAVDAPFLMYENANPLTFPPGKAFTVMR